MVNSRLLACITNVKSLRTARKFSEKQFLVTAIRMNQPCWVLCCSVLMISLLGCGGGGDAATLGQVTGVITLDGQPVEEATVTFFPENVRASTATTDSMGKYELIYIRDEKGAAIGKHKVVVSKMVDEKETLPGDYTTIETTKLVADVKAGDNSFEFALE